MALMGLHQDKSQKHTLVIPCTNDQPHTYRSSQGSSGGQPFDCLMPSNDNSPCTQKTDSVDDPSTETGDIRVSTNSKSSFGTDGIHHMRLITGPTASSVWRQDRLTYTCGNLQP